MNTPRSTTLARLGKYFLVTALVLATSFMAIACGNDDDDSNTTKTTPSTSTTDESAATQDIVDTAVAAGDFTTLVSAVQAAGLEETLRGEGPFTLFAPTDAAFDKLPEGTLEDLLKPANKDKLADILTYHVVPGSAMAADLSDGQKLTTVQGGKLTVSTADGGVMIGDAMVTTADIETSNGVIHVIDMVLLPPANK